MMENNTIRLARNTMYMYIRMSVVMIVLLYSSRLALQALGVEDYGVYSVVSSIIGVMSMLQGLFISSTQRFLNHEMGKGEQERLRQVFNISLRINTAVAILFVVSVEIVGIWFISNKLNAPPNRMVASYWVLHFSAMGAVLAIFASVFDAMVIAHEKMGFYAINSILKVCLKLAAVLYLGFSNGDRLILYAFFVFIAESVYIVSCFCFCRYHFFECRLTRSIDKSLLRSMVSFAGWQLCGNAAYALSHNGSNMVLNVYCGPVVNAARGLAYQVQAAVMHLVNSVSITVSPYSVKKYASGDIGSMFRMFNFSSKVFFLIGVLVSAPLMYNVQFVLKLWLGRIPDYSARFVQIILLWTLMRFLHAPFDTLFKAVGKIKHYQICEGIILCLPLFSMWLMLKNGGSPYWAFSMVVVFEIINLIVITFIAFRVAGLKPFQYVKNILMPATFLVLFLMGGLCALFFWHSESTVYSIFLAIVMDMFFGVYGWFLFFNDEERRSIMTLVNRKK